jgi:hypothetical protein
MTDLDLAAIGDEEDRLIAASVTLTNFLMARRMARRRMPPLLGGVMRLSFPMPDGTPRPGRLRAVADWLDEDVVNSTGTFQAYKKIDGLIAVGAHFTPTSIQADRFRRILHGERGAA